MYIRVSAANFFLLDGNFLAISKLFPFFPPVETIHMDFFDFDKTV